MSYSDWSYGADWFETWMLWETPEWTLEMAAPPLIKFLREVCGWTVRDEDWTSGASSSAAAGQSGLHDQFPPEGPYADSV